MDLPLEPIKPTGKNPKLLVLYGQPKVGKTTILSQLPDKYLILETDRFGEGADFIECLRVPIITYDDLINVTSKILEMKKPYKYVVLDTATSFEDLCEVDATKQYRKSNAGKNFEGRSVLELVSKDFAPGYRWLRLSFQLAMNQLYNCAEYIIVVCHLKDKFLKEEVDSKGKSDSKVSTKEIDLTGKIRSMLVTAADATGFVYRTDSVSGQKLWIDFRTDEVVNNGSRCPHLIQAHFEFSWDKIYLK